MVAAAPGNRPATPAEQAQITSDVGNSHPGYDISAIRIADSDHSWAALMYQPASGQGGQSFEEVRHKSGGTWEHVVDGTTQVACNPSVPAQVQSDFGDLPGFGPC